MKSKDKPDTQGPSIDDIDKTIHEPARLMILLNLYVVESVDFVFLMRQTGLTKGNLSSHLSKLESAGLIEIEKKFVEKIPRTLIKLSKEGRTAFEKYRNKLQEILNI